uniref:Uncharacterized protein n=1 Tax=Arundo donax TaxID=35708 RepID=A0A0A9C9N3_ARUDO
MQEQPRNYARSPCATMPICMHCLEEAQHRRSVKLGDLSLDSPATVTHSRSTLQRASPPMQLAYMETS